MRRAITSLAIGLLLLLVAGGVFMSNISPASADMPNWDQWQHTDWNQWQHTYNGYPIGVFQDHQPNVFVPTPTPVPTQQAASTPASTQQTAPTPTPASTQQTAPTPTPVPTQQTTSNISTSSGMTDEEAALAQQLLVQINQDRSANGGLAAYVMSDALVTSAYKHSQVLASGSCGKDLHQCPGEADPATRMTNAGASWTVCGENVGYAEGYGSYWQDILVIHQGWMNGPSDEGHRLNLLSHDFHNIGIGVFITTDGGVWFTEDFTN